MPCRGNGRSQRRRHIQPFAPPAQAILSQEMLGRRMISCLAPPVRGSKPSSSDGNRRHSFSTEARLSRGLWRRDEVRLSMFSQVDLQWFHRSSLPVINSNEKLSPWIAFYQLATLWKRPFVFERCLESGLTSHCWFPAASMYPQHLQVPAARRSSPVSFHSGSPAACSPALPRKTCKVSDLPGAAVT